MLNRMSTTDLLPPRNHNGPPSPLESAKDAGRELKKFLEDNPVIETPQQAKDGGGYVERTRITLKTMNDEQDELTAPHLATLEGIYEPRRKVRQPLERILKQLRERLTAYAARIEAERQRIAEAARQAAIEAERVAREAEKREQDAIAGADVGECTDVGSAIEEADAAFGDFQVANRAAQRADLAVPVRIRSVMGGRALSMRTTEVLTVTDAAQAIVAMGLTAKIEAAILSSARDFRKEFGELPDGVGTTKERSL